MSFISTLFGDDEFPCVPKSCSHDSWRTVDCTQLLATLQRRRSEGQEQPHPSPDRVQRVPHTAMIPSHIKWKQLSELPVICGAPWSGTSDLGFLLQEIWAGKLQRQANCCGADELPELADGWGVLVGDWDLDYLMG